MAKWWGLILMALLILSQLDDHHHQAAAAISCSQVESKLVPCMSFLKGSASASTVPAACCRGVQSLDMSYAINEPDPERRGRGQGKATCECLKQAAKSFAVDVSRAKQIPQLCNIKQPILVDPNADCTKA